MNLKNFIDFHAHVGPEILPRRFTPAKLAESEQGKIKGAVLKNHFYPTAPLIKSIESYDILLIGSITLNNYVGGLNPDAVYASAKLSDKPIVVWFPTINSRNFLEKSEYEIRPEWVGKNFVSRPSNLVKGIKVVDKEGKISGEARKVLESVRDNGSILATGHLSWEESEKLVEQALGLGIKKIIITHPIYQLIDMPIEIQSELAKNKEVYIEHSYSMYSIDKIQAKKIVEQIKSVKPINCIITSDTGQIGSPGITESIENFMKILKENSIGEDELKQMLIDNPNEIIR